MERKLGPKLQLLIRGYEEAKRQHHQLRAVLFSGAAVMHIGGHLGDLLGCDGRPTALSPSTARAAVEAFEEAEASYRPIKPLLPEMWVTEAAALATVVRQAMPQVLRFIAEPDVPQQPSSSSQPAAPFAAMMHSLTQLAEPRCAGCGKQAQGLRKCSRCRQAGYCR